MATNSTQATVTNHDIPPKVLPPKWEMTEEEFVTWCDEDTRAEWMDGRVIMMSPVSAEHSDINGWVFSLVMIFVQQRDLGVVRGPEYQVRFGRQRRRRTPDVLFVAKDRLEILRPNHAEGAPDMIVEVVSPDSEARDWREKFLEYEAAGVKEYWVIDPMSQHWEAYTLTPHPSPSGRGAGGEGRYTRIEEQDGRVNSVVLSGLAIRTEWLWQKPLPKVLDVLRELGIPT